MDNERFTLDKVPLCGGCHQWGVNPVIENGKCRDCDRTVEQIKKQHGVVFVEYLVKKY